MIDAARVLLGAKGVESSRIEEAESRGAKEPGGGFGNKFGFRIPHELLENTL